MSNLTSSTVDPDEVLLIVDDTAALFAWINYEGTPWQTVLQNTYDYPHHGFYGGSARSTEFGGTVPTDNTVSLMFEGTSISFHGLHYFPNGTGNIIYTIDGAFDDDLKPFRCDDPLSKTRLGGQWFVSGKLAMEDVHLIIFSLAGGGPASWFASLDFAVISAGPTQQFIAGTVTTDPRSETKIIVDDAFVSEVVYFGEWEERDVTVGRDVDVDSDVGVLFPFRNGTHRTKTVGSGFMFRFLGTSLQIYGCFNHRSSGSIELTFSISSSPFPSVATSSFHTNASAPATTASTYKIDSVPTSTLNLSWSTSSPKAMLPEYPHQLLHSYTSLPPQEHIVTVTVSGMDNQEFIFDYLTYTPAFKNVASKPRWDVKELELLAPSARRLTETTSSSVVVSGFASTTDRTSGNGRQISAGAIVGIALGAFTILVAMVFGVLWTWKRSRHGRAASEPNYSARNLNDIIDQFDYLGIESARSPSGTSHMHSWSPSTSNGSPSTLAKPRLPTSTSASPRISGVYDKPGGGSHGDSTANTLSSPSDSPASSETNHSNVPEPSPQAGHRRSNTVDSRPLSDAPPEYTSVLGIGEAI